MKKVYHFTKQDNVESIMKEGLLLHSKFNSLGSELRDNVIYAVLDIENDAMGYKNDKNYVCLELQVEKCQIANMDLISSAFVNFIKLKKGESLCEYTDLVKEYDTTALSYDEYTIGLFRAPEVIIKDAIPPNRIVVLDNANNNRFSNNRKAYNDNIVNRLLSFNISDDLNITVEKLINDELLKLIAIHDDSGGLLYSYYDRSKNNYFTLEQELFNYRL